MPLVWMKLGAEAFSMELHELWFRLFKITPPPLDWPSIIKQRNHQGSGMEQFWEFGNEKSISEIVRWGKIEIETLHTSLITSAGISSFRIPFFPNRYIIFRSALRSLSMVPSALLLERSFSQACPRRCADGRSISINGRDSNNG